MQLAPWRSLCVTRCWLTPSPSSPPYPPTPGGLQLQGIQVPAPLAQAQTRQQLERQQLLLSRWEERLAALMEDITALQDPQGRRSLAHGFRQWQAR